MVYLYASLGVLMLTGIMAMFEMAMSFNAQQMQFRPPTDSYSGSTYQQADRDLLRLLVKKDLLLTLSNEGAPWSGTALCDQLRCRFNPLAGEDCKGANAYDEKMFGSSPLKTYAKSVDTRSDSAELSGACAMASGQHRVLVVPNASHDRLGRVGEPYRSYSCVIGEHETECPFETKD